MAKHIPVPPRRIVDERTIFIATNLSDPDDQFVIEASDENGAKAQLIYKLGFIVENHNGKLFLVDDENKERSIGLDSETLNDAYNEVLKAAHWKVGEPTLFSNGRDVNDL